MMLCMYVHCIMQHSLVVVQEGGSIAYITLYYATLPCYGARRRQYCVHHFVLCNTPLLWCKKEVVLHNHIA